jgi:hypothetical protein
MQLDTIELPDDLEWVDEFTWTPVAQSMEYGATGSLFIQESEKQAGRTITLQGEEDMCWVSRSTVLALQALYEQTDNEMTLTLEDARTFTVRFLQSGGNPVDVSPVVKGSFYGSGDYYKINSIKLIEV